eukprot:GFUD01014176.1.p1 GENE.GFUD01014176.1~~GFUD01014176.1.p1  ORF type:complete len:147 (+),score=59.27 GFUD01014176.1:35-442(+)
MAEHCATTRGAGNNRAFEDAANSRISGELQEVESDLPEDIKERALSVFRASISDKCTIQQAIDKVQKEALVEVETRFKGQRFKGFIKFDYDTSVITINVNKFGNGNAQFSVGMGVKRMVCPDPFMGKLSDPNMNK